MSCTTRKPNCDCGTCCIACGCYPGCMSLEQPAPLPIPTAAELEASGGFARLLAPRRPR